MYVVLTVLLIIVSLFILAIVLIQNPKGGGALGSSFGSAASNIIGVQKAGDTLERLTWGAAVIMLVLAVGSAFFLPKKIESTKSIIETVNTPSSSQGSQAPVLSIPAPAETPAEAPAQ